MIDARELGYDPGPVGESYTRLGPPDREYDPRHSQLHRTSPETRSDRAHSLPGGDRTSARLANRSAEN